jgi:DNA-damage-inducible protein D
MDNEIVPASGDSSVFEEIKRRNEFGVDWWSSRDLARVLDYSNYVNFEGVITRAKQACFNSGHDVKDHFVDINEMVDIGSGAKRTVKSVMLTRYACYLIIQNADPSKEIIAKGQTYFAVQTRRQELSDEQVEQEKRLNIRKELKTHNIRLMGTVKGAGIVLAKDYAIFQNHGYQGLYGGLTAQDIHAKKGLKTGQSILDHMGSTELAANLFRATQTEEKIKREKITGKDNANRAHFEVGRKVRRTIEEIGGTPPEKLPVAESLKKIGRKGKRSLPKDEE